MRATIDHDHPERTGSPEEPSGRSGVTFLLVFVGPLVVLAALVLEILAGEAAADPSAVSRPWVPLTWPAPVRVAFWLLIGGLAVGHRLGMARLGSKPNRFVTAAIGAPFAAFAAGIAVGAPWTTWH